VKWKIAQVLFVGIILVWLAAPFFGQSGSGGGVGGGQLPTNCSSPAIGQVTCQQLNVSGGGGASAYSCSEATAPLGASGSDIFYCDSTAHQFKWNNNNAGAATPFDTLTKQDVIEAAAFCADAGASGTTYACNLSPAITAYVTGVHYRVKANTTNTACPCTINLNSLGAKTTVKVAGGITTNLAAGDWRAGQWADFVYDGTNMQMQSTSGNAPLGAMNILRCYSGLGDGLNAMTAGTYLQTNCYNNSGVTWTITRIGCFTDNAGTSTLNATNGAATGLLTGAVTCTAAAGGAAGTQSATTTIANGDVIKFTFVADGTSKQSGWFVSLTQ
jgi:hypothetical protein